MKKLFALLALTGCITAQAQTRWVADGNNDTLYRIGVPSYSDNNGVVATGWFELKSKYNGERLNLLVQVHCSSRLIRTIRSVTYYNGDVIASYPENWYAQWRNPIPGAFESLYQEMCHTR